MVVLTLLVSDQQVARVKAAVAAVHVQARSVAEAVTLLREQPVDVLVVDPAIQNPLPTPGTSAEALSELAGEFPYLPVVFYVSDAIQALPLVARFPSRERCEALVAAIDDDPEVIAQAIESAVGTTLAARLVHRLGPSTASAPDSLIRTLRCVLSNPRMFRSVGDMAVSACMSRRNLDRWLARCGLVSGRECLQLATIFVRVRQQGEWPVVSDLAAPAGGSEGPDTGNVFSTKKDHSKYEQRIRPGDEEILAHFVSRLNRERVDLSTDNNRECTPVPASGCHRGSSRKRAVNL